MCLRRNGCRTKYQQIFLNIQTSSHCSVISVKSFLWYLQALIQYTHYLYMDTLCINYWSFLHPFVCTDSLFTFIRLTLSSWKPTKMSKCSINDAQSRYLIPEEDPVDSIQNPQPDFPKWAESDINLTSLTVGSAMSPPPGYWHLRAVRDEQKQQRSWTGSKSVGQSGSFQRSWRIPKVNISWATGPASQKHSYTAPQGGQHPNSTISTEDATCQYCDPQTTDCSDHSKDWEGRGWMPWKKKQWNERK